MTAEKPSASTTRGDTSRAGRRGVAMSSTKHAAASAWFSRCSDGSRFCVLAAEKAAASTGLSSCGGAIVIDRFRWLRSSKERHIE